MAKKKPPEDDNRCCFIILGFIIGIVVMSSGYGIYMLEHWALNRKKPVNIEITNTPMLDTNEGYFIYKPIHKKAVRCEDISSEQLNRWWYYEHIARARQ